MTVPHFAIANLDQWRADPEVRQIHLRIRIRIWGGLLKLRKALPIRARLRSTGAGATFSEHIKRCHSDNRASDQSNDQTVDLLCGVQWRLREVEKWQKGHATRCIPNQHADDKEEAKLGERCKQCRDANRIRLGFNW